MDVYTMYTSMKIFSTVSTESILYYQDGYLYVQIVVYNKDVKTQLIDLGWEQIHILDGIYIWRYKL